eukprot:1627324-Alexandrium_andersonii.AAC.1
MNERAKAEKKVEDLDWYLLRPNHWRSQQRDVEADRRDVRWYSADVDWYGHFAAVAQSAIDI